SRCRATAFVADGFSNTVSTIDVKTRGRRCLRVLPGRVPHRVRAGDQGPPPWAPHADQQPAALAEPGRCGSRQYPTLADALAPIVSATTTKGAKSVGGPSID